MNRIDRALARARKEGRAALVPFVTGGDPDLDTTARLVVALAEAGADAIEIGVPHSDPIAEGPTIQASSFRALERGTNVRELLDVVRRVREVTDVALVFMGYVNNVLGFGEERFVRGCAEAGVDGLIVVDTPFEEAERLDALCEAHGVHHILLVAPTSTPERVVRIASRSRGFVYLVSVTGVTGARETVPERLAQGVEAIRRVTATPVCVGFGISTPEQAAEVGALADGVVVGSALVSRIAAAASPDGAVDAASEFTASLAKALRSGRR